jgi:hypothetical protein
MTGRGHAPCFPAARVARKTRVIRALFMTPPGGRSPTRSRHPSGQTFEAALHAEYEPRRLWLKVSRTGGNLVSREPGAIGAREDQGRSPTEPGTRQIPGVAPGSLD